MKQNIKEGFPVWCKNINPNKYCLCIGDDIDSLMTGALLQKLFGLEIIYFYDFKSFYQTTQTDKIPIGCDMAWERGYCFDNHVVQLNKNDYHNHKSANMNIINNISRDNYFQKYAMSTLLTVWSLYDIPLPNRKEAQEILLAIDTAFKGHYNDSFKQIHNKYLHMLEFQDLINILDEHNANYFYDVIIKYGLAEKIKLNNDGDLETKIDLAELQGLFDLNLKLPEEKFTVYKEYESSRHGLDKFSYLSKKNFKDKLVSLALTKKNYVNYTYARLL